MPPVTFVGSLGKIHAVLCSKIADVYGIEVHDVWTRKFVYFRKIFRVLLHNTRDVTRGERGNNSPGAESLLVTKNSQQCHKHFFRNSTFASERAQVRIWGRQIFSCPRRHLTSLRPAHHDCLAKMAKFVYKNTFLSVPNDQSQTIWNEMLLIIEDIWP